MKPAKEWAKDIRGYLGNWLRADPVLADGTTLIETLVDGVQKDAINPPTPTPAAQGEKVVDPQSYIGSIQEIEDQRKFSREQLHKMKGGGAPCPSSNMGCNAPEARSDTPSGAEFWWCNACQKAVLPIEVTYSEHHDPRQGGCGCKVSPNKGVDWKSLATNLETENMRLKSEIERLKSVRHKDFPVV